MGHLKEDGMATLGEQSITFESWATKMHKNFERCFWIPESEKDDNDFIIHKDHIHRRGIYKDVFKSSDVYTDY
jgi:glycogen debranching enzyme